MQRSVLFIRLCLLWQLSRTYFCRCNNAAVRRSVHTMCWNRYRCWTDCGPSCSTCTGNGTQCTSCASGYFGTVSITSAGTCTGLCCTRRRVGLIAVQFAQPAHRDCMYPLHARRPPIQSARVSVVDSCCVTAFTSSSRFFFNQCGGGKQLFYRRNKRKFFYCGGKRSFRQPFYRCGGSGKHWVPILVNVQCHVVYCRS